MPYVIDRWLGGMLTNFATVRKSIKKMQQIEKMENDGTFELLQKRERLMYSREKEKLERVLGGIADLSRLPSALFIVDISREHIAVAEARKLNIPTIAMVDTNSNPKLVDFPIPSNDDAAASIRLVTETISQAIREGLEERRQEREMEMQREADESSSEGQGAASASAGGEEQHQQQEQEAGTQQE
jgi:small subunit ribosomal protein S2